MSMYAQYAVLKVHEERKGSKRNAKVMYCWAKVYALSFVQEAEKPSLATLETELYT